MSKIIFLPKGFPILQNCYEFNNLGLDINFCSILQLLQQQNVRDGCTNPMFNFDYPLENTANNPSKSNENLKYQMFTLKTI